MRSDGSSAHGGQLSDSRLLQQAPCLPRNPGAPPCPPARSQQLAAQMAGVQQGRGSAAPTAWGQRTSASQAPCPPCWRRGPGPRRAAGGPHLGLLPSSFLTALEVFCSLRMLQLLPWPWPAAPSSLKFQSGLACTARSGRWVRQLGQAARRSLLPLRLPAAGPRGGGVKAAAAAAAAAADGDDDAGGLPSRARLRQLGDDALALHVQRPGRQQAPLLQLHSVWVRRRWPGLVALWTRVCTIAEEGASCATAVPGCCPTSRCCPGPRPARGLAGGCAAADQGRRLRLDRGRDPWSLQAPERRAKRAMRTMRSGDHG
jgi:hypothetical protein